MFINNVNSYFSIGSFLGFVYPGRPKCNPGLNHPRQREGLDGPASSGQDLPWIMVMPELDTFP